MFEIICFVENILESWNKVWELLVFNIFKDFGYKYIIEN